MILFIYLESLAMNCTKVTKQRKDATDSYHLLHPFFVTLNPGIVAHPGDLACSVSISRRKRLTSLLS